ncbi:unnamed protein product [Orchesella dallaii]|uniref:MARVEL domain-containing protein n=1 Tax=Orchesella dallaii TaxID=48710 RepID=A0ABP1R0N1_9HEXA
MAVIVNVDNHPNGTIPSERRIDLDYFKTPPGVVKISQFVLGVILLCVSKPLWLSVVVYLGFVVTSFWVWIYFFALQQKYQSPSLPWNVLEFYYTTGAAFAYIITSLITLFFIGWYLVALIFAVLNTVAYAIGAFLLMKDWKEWRMQGTGMMQGA